MKLYSIFFITIIFFTISAKAQIKDYELGADVMSMRFSQQTGYFNLSDPEAVNIKVAVWGWVRYPGKYLVPNYTSVADLLSYAGGPTDAADMTDLRIYRLGDDSTQSLIRFNYNDLLYESKLDNKYRKVPKLEAGDILVIPGEPRMYFKDNFGIWMSVISTLISILTFTYIIIKR